MTDKAAQRNKSVEIDNGFSRKNFLKIHKGELFDSFRELLSQPMMTLLTTAVLAVTLALPSCFYLVGKNIILLSSQITPTPTVSLFVDSELSTKNIDDLIDDLKTKPEISHIQLVTSKQGADELSSNAGFDKALSVLEENRLPNVLVITPSSTDEGYVEQLAASLTDNPLVMDVRFDKNWLKRLPLIKNLGLTLLVSFSVLLLLAVCLIVGKTLNFKVLLNKDEIQTMKLIGATDGFILRPYIYSGMWFGLLGAVFALLMTVFIGFFVGKAATNLTELYDISLSVVGLRWDEAVLLILLGVCLGIFSARFSILRQLKQIEPY